MHILAIKLKQNRDNYGDFATLVSALSRFQHNQNEENKKEITIMTELLNESQVLPSGRIGNPLAVALEMNYYTAAAFMIENAEMLELSLDHVSFSHNYSNIWNLKEVFEYSLTYFDDQIIDENSELFISDPNLSKVTNDNINSMLAIKEMLNQKFVKKRIKN